MVEEGHVVARLDPIGDIFVNGLANGYADEYPGNWDASFAEYMTKEEFDDAIKKINDALFDLWPCMPCTTLAYGCCLCTCGLSIYGASLQVKEAEERTRAQIQRINEQNNFKANKVEWKLVRIWYRRYSYIDITTTSAPIADEDTSKMQSVAMSPDAPPTEEMARVQAE